MSALMDSGLWRGEPLILASKSRGRASVLEGAGIPFVAVDSQLDERAIPGIDEKPASMQAALLARAKAHAVAMRYPGRVVAGADQTLALGERTLHKAPDIDSAIAQLCEMSGRTHALHSAVACFRDDQLLFEFVSTADIRMRALDRTVIRSYSKALGDAILHTVGCYEIEGPGANLLESVRGNMFTVIGLPLFPLLAELRRIGLIDESNGTR